MKCSTINYEDNYVLAENNNHLWQVAKITDDKCEYFDNLVYLDSKYAVVFIDNKYKIINLQTKQVIETEDKIDKIVNDIAITYNKQKLIDLNTFRNLMPDNCNVAIINGNYFVIKDITTGKCGLFDSQNKAFVFPPIYSYLEVSELGTHVLLKIENNAPLKLYDLRNYKFIRTLNDHTMFFKGNYLSNDIFEVFRVNPLEKINYDFQGPIKIFGNYAIETVKGQNDIYESKVIDLKTSKLAIDKTFNSDKYDLIINGDNLLIVLKRNVKKTKIYNLKTKEYLKTDNKEKGIKGILAKELDVSPVNNEEYYHYLDKENNIENLVFLVKKNNKIEIFNPVMQQSVIVSGVSHYLVLSQGVIRMYNGSNKGVYAPVVLNKYTKDISSVDCTRVIDTGLIYKRPIINTSLKEDYRMNLVTRNLMANRANKTKIAERETIILPEMVRVRKR